MISAAEKRWQGILAKVERGERPLYRNRKERIDERSAKLIEGASPAGPQVMKLYRSSRTSLMHLHVRSTRS